MTLTEKVEAAWNALPDEATRSWLSDVAIAIVIEEAANVVDEYALVISDWEKYQPNNSNTHGLTMADVAAAIRALAEDKP